ncbi:MAG TPA: GNAT family N-acetyltransferase [Thermoleophilia bacterium]|nr:GNAT family N-acetyltransferase [Thermoleophilia bacterium]
MPPTITYRPAAPDEASDASAIILAALNDLAARQGRPILPGPADRAVPALRHLIDTDAPRFVVADDGDGPVGFGAAMLRDSLRFCGGLFVLPEWQGRGVGRRLFELAMGEPTGGVQALTSSAANPVSNALYGRRGIYPQLPLLYLTGRLPLAATAGSVSAEQGRPRVAVGSTAALEFEPLTPTHLNELVEIDVATLGIDRGRDHRWFQETALHPGWLVRRRGRATGYVYLGGDGTEGAGALGPVATLRAQDQAPVLRFALGQLARRGVEQATVAVPGANLVAQQLLWGAGFRFPAAAGLFCASRPFGRFDRYLLAGDCLM